MKRREFITLVGGAAVGWPLVARAQQRERMRRIGLLLPAAADDVEYQVRVGAFLQALALLGWTIGRNVQIDTRWAGANTADIRRHAAELAWFADFDALPHRLYTGEMIAFRRSCSSRRSFCSIIRVNEQIATSEMRHGFVLLKFRG